MTTLLVLPTLLAPAAPSSYGTASGLGLSVALLVGAGARALTGEASSATLLGSVVVLPALLGVGAFRVLVPLHLAGDQPTPSTEPRGGDTG